MSIRNEIIETAKKNGASYAGIASMEALKKSASHMIYEKMGNYSGVGTVREDGSHQNTKLFNWPESVKSLLVVGLSHPDDEPGLDWWDGKGGTPGNRILIDIIKKTSHDIEKNINIKSTKLHYYVEKGGIFLKDAAVLAGFGCIGINNMLITPLYGPRIRLRALFLYDQIEPTGPIEFDPCSDCKVYCRKVCPENAMEKKEKIFQSIDFFQPLPGRDGAYSRNLCNDRMEKDEAESMKDNDETPIVKYCRKCELICPVGKAG